MFGLWAYNEFTERSIPLTTNYMHLSIDIDMDIDIRFQIQNQILTSLQTPAKLPLIHDRDQLHKWENSLILFTKTFFSVCRIYGMQIKIQSAKSIKGESVNIEKFMFILKEILHRMQASFKRFRN